MERLSEQIQEILDEQAGRCERLRRTLLRQGTCLRQGDVVGVGAANAEIREAVKQGSALEARLTPLLARWREGSSETGGPLQERAEAVHALVLEVEGLRARNEGLAKSAMERIRREMVALSVGANAARGYSPRPPDGARFLDRTH
jgi:hypothetical protein